MSDVTPALTPHDWATAIAGGDASRVARSYVAHLWGRHAVAALALHQQPYGFTWEDAALLRSMALASPHLDDIDAARLRTLAERIEALLPPRTSIPGE